MIDTFNIRMIQRLYLFWKVSIDLHLIFKILTIDYRVIQLNWHKLWPYYSGQEAPYEVRYVSFFSWYPDILINGFQKFQQGLYIFHRLVCWRAFIFNFCENTLKINVFEKSILFCKYLHNGSSDPYEILYGGQLLSCNPKF